MERPRPAPPFSSKFRDWLRNLLAAGTYGDTQETLAERLGVTQGYISKLKTGAAQGKLRVDLLDDFARRLGHPIEDLVWAVNNGKELPPRRDP